MATANPLLKMTPAKFESYVRGILKREKMPLKHMEVTLLEPVSDIDPPWRFQNRTGKMARNTSACAVIPRRALKKSLRCRLDEDRIGSATSTCGD
jgi:hypothetical protein